MKILHIIPRMVPSESGVFVGGSISALLNLVKETNTYLKNIIFTNTDKGHKKNFKNVDIKAEIFFDENNMEPGTLEYGIYFIISSISSLAVRKCYDADIIHGHSGFVSYILLTAIIGKILKKPTVHTLYCPVRIHTGSRLLSYVKKRLFYFALLSVDKVLAMSSNIKNSIVSIGVPPSKIDVLPPFFDIEKFNPNRRSAKIREKIGAQSDEPIILCVGNLKYSKGLDVLIEALGMIVKKYRFRFVYTLELKDKSFENNLAKINDAIQKNGLSECTTKLGIISFMPDLMASCDLIVIPYRNTDGPSDYPIALMEAMASGIPVVATNAGGIPELAENGVTGILVEPQNVYELANAIEKMVVDPVYRKELGKNARERCCEIMKTRNIGREIFAIYNQLT